MIEQWGLPAQRVPNLNMARSAGNPFLSPQQVCDLHQMIVNDVRELIRRQAVWFQDDEIIHICILEDHIPMQFVVDIRLAPQWQRYPHGSCETVAVNGSHLLEPPLTAG